MKSLTVLFSLLILLYSFAFAEKIEKEFVSENGKSLTVDINSGGDIQVEGWDEGKIKVVVEYDGPENAGFVDYDYASGDLDISVNMANISDRIDDVRFVINVPYKFNIELQTMGGDVSVRNIQGEISGKTMGGDLAFDKINGVINMTTMGGDIEVDEAADGAVVSTMGGDITVKKANKFIKAKTMGGDIELMAVDGSIKASTMGGDIEAVMVGDVNKGKRDVNLSSMDGDIELTLPKELSIAFDIRLTYTKNSSRNYKIDADFPIEIKESKDWVYGNGHAKKVIEGSGEVNGGKNRVKISTTNGNITIHAE